MSAFTPRRLGVGLALVLLLTLPIWVGNPYYINISSQILLFAVFALALNVLVGYAGLVSLGHAGLFATAGYAGALLLQAGLHLGQARPPLLLLGGRRSCQQEVAFFRGQVVTTFRPAAGLFELLPPQQIIVMST